MPMAAPKHVERDIDADRDVRPFAREFHGTLAPMIAASRISPDSYVRMMRSGSARRSGVKRRSRTADLLDARRRLKLLAMRAACEKVEIVAQLEPPRACTLGTFPPVLILTALKGDAAPT